MKTLSKMQQHPAAIVEISKTPTGSDAERIAAVRTKSIERSKHFGRTHQFDRHPESHYQDFAGEQTSHFDFDDISYRLSMLEHPTYRKLWCNKENGKYDRTTATWNCDEQVAKFVGTGTTLSLADLKSALAERIAELKILEALLVEWLAVPHGIEADQAFNRLSFDERMKTFRSPQESL